MNRAAYAIRQATPDDAEAIMAVHVRSILELGVSAYTRAEAESWAARLRPEGYVRIMTEGVEFFEVAVGDAEAIVGFCSVAGNEIMGLYVDPDWARCGIASAFVARAERRIGDAGHDCVVIRAARSGLPFYLARGYAVEHEAEWQTRGGLVLMMAILCKQL
jgi:GNAT superfamily N-acetyltransferase